MLAFASERIEDGVFRRVGVVGTAAASFAKGVAFVKRASGEVGFAHFEVKNGGAGSLPALDQGSEER